MIDRLLLLGATGDLAGRFLLPALARLSADGRMPDGLQVVGGAAQDWDDRTFRSHVATRLREHAGDVPATVRDALVGRLRYRAVDPAAAGTVAAAARAFDDDDAADRAAVAVYLALPPAVFPAMLGALGDADLPAGSRIAVEKPFGTDLASAAALNGLLTRVTGGVEEAAFRVDHFLGMPTVQALLDLRAPGRPLAPVWDSAAIAEVEVLWEETLGLEGRADFYDRTGAVRDVMQNHMLQVLTLVAMELPARQTEGDLHAAKLELLRSVRVLSAAEIPARSRRARYTAGTLSGTGATGGRTVPGYTDEDGVDPARGTETYAEVLLELDTPRWTGTRFVLRTGKALGTPRKGIALHFRTAAPACDPCDAERGAADRSWIELDAPEEGRPPGAQVAAPGERTAYGQVLTDLLSGGTRLSVSGEEAEQAWRIVDPVLQAWAQDAVPLLEYPAGGAGPPLLGGTVGSRRE
ncbi:glucose-6-phosphate 1-dehydrogenase [Geodermatophilus amargosae]|uniref:Glucose-6-phosphate 1-dehydrogenase n=1 Tax=Geodermatophilus amargosae TaxID=1296565 RepID=A0A1I6YRU4_9ACTN|nr:glucose-6-phosphate dehydrogenase [Geodermatophilus amargosae]SFT53185.1 glucose-6-phosphate 1-dehydrogenase [Geodermatophilus amargosae]